MHKLPNFADSKVLVIGDVMLDRYWHGSTSRISPEAPVPVVNIGEMENRPGGAANVALNVAVLGSFSMVLGVSGLDEAGQRIIDYIEAKGVHSLIEQRPEVPSITKVRVLSRNQQLLRLDFEKPARLFASVDLLPQFEKALNSCEAVVISDYGKGTVLNPQPYIQMAIKNGKKVLVDPKGNDFSKYKGATLITPNLSEFEAVVGSCNNQDELVSKALQLCKQHKIEALLITQGANGMTLVSSKVQGLHVDAKAREVFDVTGAGDTVIAVMAAVMSLGIDMEEAMRIANTAAGIVVAKMGTACVTAAEIEREIRSDDSITHGVVAENQLKMLVAGAKSNGEKIVMTNGCFDILHMGHIHYLEEAKSLGDRLIIAVNTDASVRKLKGPDRPINSIDERMGVLAALEMVDWVVPFAEETPERIISEICPDVLVKGGDYKDPTTLAGAKAVLANGGDVKILQYVPGCSTSSMINKIIDSKAEQQKVFEGV